MRGWERDQLAENERFKLFLHSEYNGEPVFLVATSAGEVGINLTCDRLITGLREADHLLQRFGRLNRFGETEGEAHVVYSPPKKQDRLSATLDYLRSLGGDVSASNSGAISRRKKLVRDSEVRPARQQTHRDLVADYVWRPPCSSGRAMAAWAAGSRCS